MQNKYNQPQGFPQMGQVNRYSGYQNNSSGQQPIQQQQQQQQQPQQQQAGLYNRGGSQYNNAVGNKQSYVKKKKYNINL